MNLVNNPWIPVVLHKGECEQISLQALFARAHELRDLVAAPHERIALYRLLICITQAALDGPPDRAAWQNNKDSVQTEVQGYLKEWHSSFELFGNGVRFLQCKSPRHEKPGPLEKLDFIDDEGSTLFDQHVGGLYQYRPSLMARWLITYQNFAAGGLIGGKRKIDGVNFSPSATSAPCIDQSAFHSFLVGKNLLETIWLNLVNKEDIERLSNLEWDTPIWEIKGISISDFKTVSPNGYLSRLAPMSRAVLLDENGRHVLITNGIEYANFEKTGTHEISTTKCTTNDKVFLLSAETRKKILQPWRSLHALALQKASKNSNGALVLQNLTDDQEGTLWVGAMGANQAKIIDLVESFAPVPAALRTDIGATAYREGIHFAEAWERGIFSAINLWAESLGIQAKPKGPKLSDHPTMTFWTHMESNLGLLMEAVRNHTAIPRTEDSRMDFASTDWGRACRSAAEDAYEHACGHSTPRQIQAYALGLKQLYPTTGYPAKPAKTSGTKKSQRL